MLDRSQCYPNWALVSEFWFVCSHIDGGCESLFEIHKSSVMRPGGSVILINIPLNKNTFIQKKIQLNILL